MNKLRFTTSLPQAFGMVGEALVTPTDLKGIDYYEVKLKKAYIHGEAEVKAGYDIPIILDGDLAQLDLPIEEQAIEMMLPSGNFLCTSKPGPENAYLLELKKI